MDRDFIGTAKELRQKVKYNVSLCISRKEVKHILPDGEVKDSYGAFPYSYKIIHSPYL